MIDYSDAVDKDALFCLPSDRLSRVAEIMANRHDGPALTIEDILTRRLAGIVTDRDPAVNVFAAGLDPRTTQVRAVMAGRVVSVLAEVDLEQAIALMDSMHLQQITVLDTNNRLLGILTYHEVAQRLFEAVKSIALVKLTAPAGAAVIRTGVTKWEHF